ncbi:MAG TPA: MMPL family transporter [Micromonosporaceae bacterium]
MAVARDTESGGTPPPTDHGGAGSGGGRRRRGVLRWLLPVLAVVIWVLVGGAFGPLFSKTSEVQKNDNTAFLPKNAESTEVQNLNKKFIDVETTPAVLVYTRDSGLTPADLAKINGDVQRIGAHFAGQLAGPPIGPVVSQDRQAAQVIVQFVGSDADKVKSDVAWTRDAIGGADGLRAHVTGPAGILTDLINSFAGINGVLLIVTGIIVLIILILVYRSPLLPLLVLGSAIMALAAANGMVYLLAKNDLLTLNGQSQGILDVLVLGAATDYALLLVSRYREELRRQPSRFDAMRVSWRAVVEPILASGATVIIALMCLLLSDLSSNRGLGPVGAIGIACSLAAMLTLLPALLTLIGRASFWPFRPRYGSRLVEQHGIWSRVAGVVGRRYRLIWIITAIVLIALSGGLVKLNANGIPQDRAFTTSADSKTGQQELGDHFPGGSGTPAVVITNAAELPHVVAASQGVPGVAQVVPYTGATVPPVPGAPSPPPKVVDGLARVDVTLTAAPDSAQSYDTTRALRDAVHAVPGADAKVGGFTAVNLDVQNTAKRDRTLIIPVVLAVVFVILMLLLRAVIAPIMLVATVVLSFFATLGVCGLAFRYLFGFPGADSSFPLFAFVFLVALGVDYNIFLMTRVREEVGRRGHRPGVLVALAVTGGVITSAGVVLAATFATLSVLPLVFIAEIAFAVAFGVLLDTLVVRSLLVPALTLDIGRFSWWPSRLRKVTDREVGTGAEPRAEPVTLP